MTGCRMRYRTRQCADCGETKDALYRCRYGAVSDWVFLCSACLDVVKTAHPETYQYGGTWKSRKR